MDGKAFHSYVKLPSTAATTNSATLWIGGEYLTGFYFDVRVNEVTFRHTSSDGETNFGVIDPTVFGLETLVDQTIELALTTEFYNNNGTTINILTFKTNQLIHCNNKYLYTPDGLVENQYGWQNQHHRT